MLKLSKKVIEAELVPHLPQSSRGPAPREGTWRIIRAILYRLKSGCQWRELPVRSLFTRKVSWESIYHHFKKWVRNGGWRRIWVTLLELNRQFLDMSSVSLDGSHTIARQGGQEVGYQRRKKAKTTNMLFLTDNQGVPLACSAPIAGNHHDCYEILDSMQVMNETFKEAKLSWEGIFMNADAGFDCGVLRRWANSQGIQANFDFNKRNAKQENVQYCYFDKLLYQNRFVIERTNAWIDGFKTLVVRYEKLADTWMAMHYLAFSIIFLRKIGYKL